MTLEQRQEALEQADMAVKAYKANKVNTSPFARIYEDLAQGLADLLTRSGLLTEQESNELRISVDLGIENKEQQNG